MRILKYNLWFNLGGNMNKEKLKSVFTSKIAIGIICFIIGGIALGNSSSGVNLTKERYDQL